MNSLKESHLLRMGSANEILLNMRKADEDKLLTGISKHNYETFWEINTLNIDKHVADMKRFAVRVYSNKLDRMIIPNFKIEDFRD